MIGFQKKTNNGHWTYFYKIGQMTIICFLLKFYIVGMLKI